MIFRKRAQVTKEHLALAKDRAQKAYDEYRFAMESYCKLKDAPMDVIIGMQIRERETYKARTEADKFYEKLWERYKKENRLP